MLASSLCAAVLTAGEPPRERETSVLTVGEPPRGSGSRGGYYPLIVIKGERHTGTNFITNILEKSFGSAIRVLSGASDTDPLVSCNPFEREPPKTYCCWKHGYASTWCHGFQSPDLPALPGGVVSSLPPHVFLVRSPYPWLLSMHDEPYDYDGDLTFNFSQFIRAPFSYVPRDLQGTSLSGDPDYHANPIQLWNAKVRSYLQFESDVHYGDEPDGHRKDRAIVARVTHETLYDLKSLTKSLAPLLNISADVKDTVIEYPPFALYNNKFGEAFSKADFEKAKQYEVEERWLDLLSQEDLDFINMELESNVVEQAGLQVVLEARGSEPVPQHSPRRRLQRAEHMRMLRMLDDSDPMSRAVRNREKRGVHNQMRDQQGGG
jgi:hypothetical protein